MKVQELRSLLEKADRSYVEKAFAESYKQLTKRQKEEIDPVITDILEGKEVEKKKKGSAVSFEELEREIEIFLENAYAQNYFAPNRVIPKSLRPKWRFMVKNFIKELEKIPVESENYDRSVKLLTELYKLICEACSYYLFSTEDAFRSIGWSQPDLFALLVKKTFAAGYTRENISGLISLAISGGLSREALYVMQEMVLLSELKTSDVKQIAIEEAKRLTDDREKKGKETGKNDNRWYELKEEINELCAVILMISVELAEPEEGIKFYFKHAQNSNREITLYWALRLMDWMEEEEMWIKVYEYGLSKKIRPREGLRESYERRKKESAGKAEEDI